MELKTARGRLFLLIFLLISFPLLNYHSNIISSAHLYGVEYATSPAWSWHSWWDGSFQRDEDLYINDNVGFRADLIRFNNQINFSFFDKIISCCVVRGLHDNLFYNDYVEAYCGTDYAGDNYPVNDLVKMKKVQDTLEHLGKLFVFIHAGSKASYFAEDIPTDIPCNSAGKTNLKNYIRIGDSLGIHQIDFNSWFVSLKGKMPHDLFNKQGIHWGLYGALFAVDSLTRYIEHRRGIHMIHPKWDEIEKTYNARRLEDDMERTFNLILPMRTAEYWYPKWHYDDSPGLMKPRVIYIGDSFGWTFMHDGIMNANTDPEFWIYFRDAYGKDFDNGALTHDMGSYKWREVLQKTDCVVMMYTASQLVRSGTTFIDSAYNYYYPAK